jgi:hypothetical protein
MPDPSNYYIARKTRFLSEFDFIAKSAHSVLTGYFSGENVNVLIDETRREFENLIPQLPYIGGKQQSSWQNSRRDWRVGLRNWQGFSEDLSSLSSAFLRRHEFFQILFEPPA